MIGTIYGQVGPAFPATPAGLKLAVQGTKRSIQKREYMVAAKRYTAARNNGVPSQMLNILNATNTSPVVYTTDKAHGFNVGDTVNVQGVTGNTNANVNAVVASTPTTTTFTCTGVNGNAAYAETVGVAGGATADGPLTSGEGADLFFLQNGAVITALEMISGDPLTSTDMELWIYSVGDAAASPSLKIPIMNLVGRANNGPTWNGFGAGYDQYNLKFGNGTLFTDNFFIDYQTFDTANQTANTGFNLVLYYPIPNVQRITIFNPNTSSDGSPNLYTMIEYTTDITSPLKLRANTSPAILGAGAYGSNFANFDGTADSTHTINLLNLASGVGWLVGFFIKITNQASQFNNSMLERNWSFRRDGETNPSWITSGGEDLWGCAFYNQGRVTYQGPDSFVSFNRPAGNFNGAQANVPIWWVGFKDFLAKIGGLSFTNGCIFRWELGPDASRVTANSSIQHTCLYYTL